MIVSGGGGQKRGLAGTSVKFTRFDSCEKKKTDIVKNV